MTRHLGQRASRVHLLLVSALAITGLVLLIVLVAAALTGDRYTRDMALLGGIITAPVWLIGIVAAVDTLRTIRGGPVSRIRAFAWALLATVGGAFLAYSFGHLALLAALAGVSGSAVLEWPAIALVSDDGMSATYLRLTDPIFWAPILAIVLGSASLVAQATDRAAAGSEPPAAG